MHHADKTVTIYHKQWDAERGVDTYRGTILAGVSFFAKTATAVSTDGLTAANEATLRIPAEALPADLLIRNGDLVCEGALQTNPASRLAIDKLCSQVYTVVGVTRNTSGREPHVKVVCK